MANYIKTKNGVTNNGTKGGIFKGDRHSEPSGGIEVDVIGGGSVLVEDSEPVIIPEAVNNPKLHSFDGEKLTSKQILDRINRKYGGVSIKKKGGMLEKGGLLAPNGNKSNLTPEQYKLVRTAAFKEWFGDWENDPENSSKVVDKNGEPLVVYHGSKSGNITIFDRNKSERLSSGLKEYGIYFTDNLTLAEFYRDKSIMREDVVKSINTEINKLEAHLENVKTAREFISISNEIKNLENRKSGKVYAVFLNLRKVKIFNALGETNVEAWNNLEVKADYKTAINRDAMDFLKEGKFGVEKVDGVIAKNIVDAFVQTEDLKHKFKGTAILVFDGNPNQIKLADGTNKTFDSKNPDIRYENGGAIPVKAGSVIITRNAALDKKTKHDFNGENLTNEQVLSRINKDGGGVEFEEGGKVGEEINESNFFKATRAEFKGINRKEAEEILDKYVATRRKKVKPEFIETSLGKLSINFESEHKSAFFQSRSLSYYFISENKDFVIRISDHWSESNYPRSGKLNCGSIASCYWTNFGERFNYRLPAQSYSSDLIAGICYFKDFSKIVRPEFEEGGEIIPCGCNHEKGGEVDGLTEGQRQKILKLKHLARDRFFKENVQNNTTIRADKQNERAGAKFSDEYIQFRKEKTAYIISLGEIEDLLASGKINEAYLKAKKDKSFNELVEAVENARGYAKGGEVENTLVLCQNCGHDWSTKDKNPNYKYICFKCTYNNEKYHK